MKEWTLMFYFASDSPLAPSIVPQLKSIKQAGFHQEVNVVAHFDPHPVGAPTHIFDVNYVNKLKAKRSFPPGNRIGYSGRTVEDPFVSNLIEDKLWNNETDRNGNPIREGIIKSLGKIGYEPAVPPPFTKMVAMVDGDKCETGKDAPLTPSDTREEPGENNPQKSKEKKEKEVELNPKESLSAFLNFCAEKYPARHYILFILGHGMVVANDIFLYDENADAQSLSLGNLRKVLNGFKETLEQHAPGGELELISFHSCSVSSVEVAYELQGAASYMLASQGPAFVGSYPYRQILMRLFRDTDELKKQGDEGQREKVRSKIKETLGDITSYCFYNSTDFLLAGYSFDVTLCDLTAVSDSLTKPLKRLREALVGGLKDPLVNSMILLAHLKAQSDWEENYTDLRDFCYCLGKQATVLRGRLAPDSQDAPGGTADILDAIIRECELLCGLMTDGEGGNGVIVKSDFVGPEHQYSHGLSVYFPWTRPANDEQRLSDYRKYRFNFETQWFDFLDAYFEDTRRRSRIIEENGEEVEVDSGRRFTRKQLCEDMASLVFTRGGGARPGGEVTLSGPALPADKVNPNDKTGGQCTCPSIKNYPRDTRDVRARGRTAPEQERGKVYVPSSRSNALLPDDD